MAETVLDISRDIFQACRVYDRVHQVPFLHDFKRETQEVANRRIRHGACTSLPLLPCQHGRRSIYALLELVP